MIAEHANNWTLRSPILNKIHLRLTSEQTSLRLVGGSHGPSRKWSAAINRTNADAASCQPAQDATEPLPPVAVIAGEDHRPNGQRRPSAVQAFIQRWRCDFGGRGVGGKLRMGPAEAVRGLQSTKRLYLFNLIGNSTTAVECEKKIKNKSSFEEGLQ